VVDQVLEEIGAGDVPQLRVFNKIDLMGASVPAGEDQEAAVPGCNPRESSVPAATMQPRIDRDAEGRPQAVWLSAATGAGIELLRQALGELLGGERVQSELRLPLTAGRLHARLKAAGAIAGERVDEHGWCLRIDAPRSVIAPLNGGSTAETELLRALLAEPSPDPASLC